MRYLSTRDRRVSADAAEAIVRGLAPDGGLYIPESTPPLNVPVDTLLGMTYAERAAHIMGHYLTDFTAEELGELSTRAYNSGRFDAPTCAPVHSLDGDMHVLELWHGPTCAFKDMALQMLPHLLTASLRKCGETREALILTATSGDTGKAALEGFCDVPGARIMVFYPRKGVSRAQELQMITQEGRNVSVYAVAGNFDDAQNGVKALFSNKLLAEKLANRGLFFSSANSINWGRLVPQIAYFFSAYCDLINSGRVRRGEPIHICVPTGNFGNILAALFAAEMGLPVGKLLCASNRNNVLTDFIQMGTYDRRRPFYNTLSPSMDILISSNLERALYMLSGGRDAIVLDCMKSLAEIGRYSLPRVMHDTFAKRFVAGFCDDVQTKSTIGDVFRESGYLMDPHTAVAIHVARAYRRASGDETPMLIASTASPFKFSNAVLSALGDTSPADDASERLSELTGWPVPEALRGLDKKPVRFSECLPVAQMENAVWAFAGGEG